jgi:membrane protein
MRRIEMDKVINFLKKKFGEKKWISFVEQLLCRYKDDSVPQQGAQLTYYLMLSIFPFMIFLLSMLRFTPLADYDVISTVINPLPQDTQRLLGDLLRDIIEGGTVGLLSFGAITAIWSSSRGVMSLIESVNRAYDLEESRPFWKLRGLSIILTLGLVLMLIVAFGGLVFGEVIFDMVFDTASAGARLLWTVLKIAVPLLFMVLVFSLLYKFAPSVKKGVKIDMEDTFPGAAFAAIGLIIASFAFSFYVNRFGNYTRTYGSLGAVIVFMLWLYISSIILVLGAEVNASVLAMKDKPPVGDDEEKAF